MSRRLLKLLISMLVRCVDLLSAGLRRLFGMPSATTCVVLYYHAVRSAERRQFAAQMDDLARLTVPIDIESQEQRGHGVRYSAVTFDDGFMSVVDQALPELAKRNIPCTIFAPSGSIGRRPSWIETSHPDGTEVVFPEAVMKAIATQPLVRIASHSVSHPDFRKLDDEQAKSEFVDSRATIEAIIGRKVTSFSFPHGAHTQRSIDLAAECGYARVFTIDPVQLGEPWRGFVVGRVRVEPVDWSIEFRLKVLGAYRWMSSASRVKRRLLRMINRRTAAPHSTLSGA